MLKGKAKKEYQREYMKRKRSNSGSNIEPNKNKGLRALGMMAELKFSKAKQAKGLMR